MFSSAPHNLRRVAPHVGHASVVDAVLQLPSPVLYLLSHASDVLFPVLYLLPQTFDVLARPWLGNLALEPRVVALSLPTL